jgi:hypothetical protein
VGNAGVGSVTALGVVRERRAAGRKRENLAAYGFLAPWQLGLLLITIGPIVASLYLSFTDYNLLQPAKWVGLNNFSRMLSDERLHHALRVTFTYVLVSVPVQLALALLLAVVLDRGVRGMAFYRSIFYLPSLPVHHHADDDHAADPCGDRAAVRHVLPVGLDQHVPAVDRAEDAGHRRVLRVPDGAVHPGHPARPGRRRSDRRLRPGRDLPAGDPSADGAGARHHGDLHVHLDLERLLPPTDLPHRPGHVHGSGRPSVLCGHHTSSTWGPMFAMSVVSLLPVFPAFLIGQRFLVRGIATTGIK